MIRNTASQTISARLNALTDGTAVTSGTTTVYVTKDNGTQATGAGTVTHEGNGEWSYVPTQAETDAVQIAFMFTNSLAIGVLINVYTRPVGTGFPAVDASNRVNVGQVMGQVLSLSGNVVTFPFGVLLQPTAESTVALNIRGGAAATGLWIRGGNYAATPDVTGSGLVIGTGADSGNDGVHRAIVLNKGATPTDAMSADGGLNAVLATVTTATNVTNLPSIPANWLTAAGTASDFGTEIADAVLSRSVATVEATAPEHSLATVVLATLENTISGGTLTIRRTDGSTTHYTKTLTTDPAAEPITGIQ